MSVNYESRASIGNDYIQFPYPGKADRNRRIPKKIDKEWRQQRGIVGKQIKEDEAERLQEAQRREVQRQRGVVEDQRREQRKQERVDRRRIEDRKLQRKLRR